MEEMLPHVATVDDAFSVFIESLPAAGILATIVVLTFLVFSCSPVAD